MTLIFSILIGSFIGFTAGLFGIGGALMATPLLKLGLGLPAYLALATPLPATLPAAISGSIAYSREKLLRLDVAGPVLLTAVPMSIVGAYITRFTSGAFLMVATGAMLAYSAWIFIKRGWKLGRPDLPPSDAAERRPWGMLLSSGLLAGFMSGFLAIGGGIVLVPTFVKIVRLETKQALATSLFCVAALAVPGVIVHGMQGHIDWELALILCVTVVPLSYLGARTATLMRSSTLEKLYGIAMMAFAIFFIIKNL